MPATRGSIPRPTSDGTTSEILVDIDGGVLVDISGATLDIEPPLREETDVTIGEDFEQVESDAPEVIAEDGTVLPGGEVGSAYDDPGVVDDGSYYDDYDYYEDSYYYDDGSYYFEYDYYEDSYYYDDYDYYAEDYAFAELAA